ncbi:MAG TPA: hypothetical protein DHV42_06450 [Lachnospiraceae bacterium]|nr:hypothetical protein [Lachnospiraceae bacterium]
MFREETVEELSDGKLYTANDLVRIGTNDCHGCTDCCKMGPVIVLDPLDAFELNRFLPQRFHELAGKTVEFKVIDGLILPILKLVPAPESVGADGSAASAGSSERTGAAASAGSSERTGSADAAGLADQAGSAASVGSSEPAGFTDPAEPMVCPYLGQDGRCSIHEFRPGICRMYPLGRSWENGDFHYILQVNECTHCTGTKIKVKKWLGIPNLGAYEDFCRSWHGLLERVRHLLEGENPAGSFYQQVCTYLLRQFYLCDWDVDDFYTTFEERRKDALSYLGFATL